MVLIFILTLVLLPAILWQEVELSFISRDFKENVTYTFLLPAGYKQIIFDPEEGGRQLVLFQYPSGATFYMTNDANCHPNGYNLDKAQSDWAPGAGNYLVDNDLLADPDIHQEYSIPDKVEYSGHNLRFRWWRDLQSYEISYGYLKANRKWKKLFDQVFDSIIETGRAKRL